MRDEGDGSVAGDRPWAGVRGPCGELQLQLVDERCAAPAAPPPLRWARGCAGRSAWVRTRRTKDEKAHGDTLGGGREGGRTRVHAESAESEELQGAQKNEVLPHGTRTTVLVLADSQLAICTTTGAWAARSNRTLVNKNKRALARLRGKGVDVRFRHIRAHDGHRMNERADALAKQGGQGLRQREGSYYLPLPPLPCRISVSRA